MSLSSSTTRMRQGESVAHRAGAGAGSLTGGILSFFMTCEFKLNTKTWQTPWGEYPIRDPGRTGHGARREFRAGSVRRRGKLLEFRAFTLPEDGFDTRHIHLDFRRQML